MKIFSFCFAALLLTMLHSASWAQCYDEAAVYEFKYNKHTYKLVKSTKKWKDAAACAVENGGYLVSIDDKAEQDAINHQMLMAGLKRDYIDQYKGLIWIGATDLKEEGKWIWDGDNDGKGRLFWTGEGQNGAEDGKPTAGAYNNWGGTSKGKPMEPDNWGDWGQNAAALCLMNWPDEAGALGVAGEWNDLMDATPLYFLIEFDK